MITATVSKWGNSLGIRIPKEITSHIGIQEGDVVELDLRKVNNLPSTLKEFLAQKKWNGQIEQEPEVEFGEPVGEEVW